MKTVQYRRRKYAAEIAGVVDTFIPLRRNTPPLGAGTPSAIAYGVGPMNGGVDPANPAEREKWGLATEG